MKVLLIGHYPPPHGGISVHVARAQEELERVGTPCRVLDVNWRAAPEANFIVPCSRRRLPLVLLKHASGGWTFHIHTNGHNLKSWLLVLICAVIGRFGSGALLTIHSGMAPEYLAGGRRRRMIARLACACCRRVICVSPEIQRAVLAGGVPRRKTGIMPAFLFSRVSAVQLPSEIEGWLQRHNPVLATTLFFRPEYGFELLLKAVGLLLHRRPRLGCLVMGDGQKAPAARAQIAGQRLEHAVRLLGDVDHDLCLAAMARASLLVRPTLVDGDAVSVREALALGVPVVASDVGNRPRGTILFQPGSVKDLVAKIEFALARRRQPRSPEAAAPAGDFQGLIQIYDRMAA